MKCRFTATMPIAKGLLELGDTPTIDAPFSQLQHQLYLEKPRCLPQCLCVILFMKQHVSSVLH